MDPGRACHMYFRGSRAIPSIALDLIVRGGFLNASDQTQSIAVLALDGETIVKASEETNVRGLTSLDALDSLTFAPSFDCTVCWFEPENDGSIARIGAFEADAPHLAALPIVERGGVPHLTRLAAIQDDSAVQICLAKEPDSD
jgi:hypothetical protein